MESLKVGEKLGSERLCKVASTNLGNTLWKLGDWISALQYYKMNLSLSESEGDLWDLITAYNNIGIVEFSRGNFQAAANTSRRASGSTRKSARSSSKRWPGRTWRGLEMLGRWGDALAQYNRCLACRDSTTRASRSSVYIPLARLMNKKGDIARAMSYAQKAIAAAERARDEDLIAEASYVMANIEDEREN